MAKRQEDKKKIFTKSSEKIGNKKSYNESNMYNKKAKNKQFNDTKSQSEKATYKKKFNNDTKSHLDNKQDKKKDTNIKKSSIKSKAQIRKTEKAKQEKINREMGVTKSYKVSYSNTLLEFLLEKCKTSRNTVKHLLASHKVLVNGTMVSQYNYNLVKDDVVALSKYSVGENDAVDKKFVTRFNTIKLPFKVIYEDDDFIAINKPSGLLSVESDTERESAYSYLLRYFATKDKTNRPYQLHRIDKETSGVLVFAKNPVIHSMLKTKWNDLVKTREYYAVVEGVINQDKGTYVSYLKENANNVVYSSLDKTGKRAVTHYELVSHNEKFSLLKVDIDTGRKNQIRVHMHDIKHPIVGDEKYGYTENPLNRLGLHASKLEFINPHTHKLISIEAPVPNEYYKVVE